MLRGHSELAPASVTELARKRNGVDMCVKTGVLRAIRVASVSCAHVGG